MAVLEVNNLSVGFGSKDGEAVTVVDGISFSLEKGEVLGIVGESGSGKSVTALSILGLLPYPKAFHKVGSSIKLEGKELINAPEESLRKIRGSKVGFIFQEPMSSLNPLHRIEDQIAESLMLHQGLTRQEANRKVLKLLILTGIKNARKRMKAYPYELSGGQRQRVMIAMAIANNPDILIADEPTTALDVTVQQQIIDLLLDLKKKLGMAIIFISHDLQVIRKIADRVCVMKNGRIVECDKTGEIFNHPKCSYTKTLINSHSPLKINNNIHGDVLLKIEDLKVWFPLKKNFWGKVEEYVKAVDGVSLEIKAGETLGIVGESGSGKSTLGLSIVGLNKYSGDIILNNHSDVSVSESNRLSVQIVFQDPYNALNPRMNIEEIVREGLDIHFSQLSDDEKRKSVIRVLREVGLDENVLSKYPHEFSGGQRQRIAIARALILEPELLILDEPTSALDVTIQAQVIKLLQDIQQKRGLSYIFISHDMLAVKAMADKIAVMKDGKIVEYGESAQIFSKPVSPYTQNLISAAL